ncbi:MAG TPA: outer membrane beta-barrel protein, partial [Vicinamibacterales bacterium]|nr:outer membrane beta-barrel protein [Vicinamibacterales bacterium]
MRRRSAAMVAIVVAIAAPAAAQDAPTFFSRTSLSGYIDTYYAYNRNHPATPCAVVNGVEIFNCLHAFDVANNSFSINLAALAVEKVPTADSRVGFRVDLGFGSGPALIAGEQSEPNGPSKNFQQAYGSYLVSDRGALRVDVGKFVTPAGFEKIDPLQDWNASRSLLFALAIPREHVGVRTLWVPNSHIAVTGVVGNGWSDLTPNPGGKLAGASVAVRPFDRLTVTETYLGGVESGVDLDGWRDLSDTIVVARIANQLSLAINADFGRDRRTLQSWQGEAAYLRYEVTRWFAITPRLEALRDPNGFMTGVAQDLQEATATAEFRDPRGFVLRLEYRVDVVDRPFFLKTVSTTVRTQSIASANCVV